MKTLLTLIVCWFGISAVHAEQTLEEILQKRDSILTALLEVAKSGREEGRATEEDVHEATIRLHTFRRESARSQADRIKSQELIVSAEKEAAANIKARIAVGLMTQRTGMLAEERVLAAEQKLAELRLEK
jgi:outer membrane protein TolC